MRPASIPYSVGLPLNEKAVAMMANAQTSDQTMADLPNLLELDVIVGTGAWICQAISGCLTADRKVTHIGQNANSRYATMVPSNKKAPERCAKYGIKNQGTALSGWKQFTCAKFSYFFNGSMRPFTDYFRDYGGFTSRADCFALLPWWRPSPLRLSCAGLFTSAITERICPI
jgi:hypothetical protein